MNCQKHARILNYQKLIACNLFSSETLEDTVITEKQHENLGQQLDYKKALMEVDQLSLKDEPQPLQIEWVVFCTP